MIDCPPSLGVLTINALAAADEVFIPLQPHFLALQGLSKLLKTVSLVSQRLNPGLRVGGILLCMYESNTRLAGEVVDNIKTFLDGGRGKTLPWSKAVFFKTRIRATSSWRNRRRTGSRSSSTARRQLGATDYSRLAREVLGLNEPETAEPPAEAAPKQTPPAAAAGGNGDGAMPEATAAGSPQGDTAPAV